MFFVVSSHKVASDMAWCIILSVKQTNVDSEEQTISVKLASEYTYLFNEKYLWKYHWQNGFQNHEESTLFTSWLSLPDKRKSSPDR